MRVLLAALLLLCACAGGCQGARPAPGDFVVGGHRPATVHVPGGFDDRVPAPLLLFLHGYGGSGSGGTRWLGLAQVARDRGLLYVEPDGTRDGQGNRFWNATAACCNRHGSTVDDLAYLTGLIDEIGRKVALDRHRVYVVGHSNGGFMAYRMACDVPDRVAAIVSLGGAMPLDPADCKSTRPVSVLQIHADLDSTVPFRGGSLFGSEIPGARQATDHFALLAGCQVTAPAAGPSRDLDASVPGPETTALIYPGCAAGLGVELWTMVDGHHNPQVTPDFGPSVVDFLLAHQGR